jgi:Uma2 family endonuclease
MVMAPPIAGLIVDDVGLLTVEQFDRMVEGGILTDEDRVELLEGVLVAMTPIGDVHAACVDRLNEVLTLQLSPRAAVRVQGPISLPRSRPYPDLAVLRRRVDHYAKGKPEAADIYLVIEVADTSLRRDRDFKLPAYGRAAIPEAWVVDLAGDAVIVGRGPGPAGYARVTVHRRGDRLAVPGFADVVLTVDQIVGTPD